MIAAGKAGVDESLDCPKDYKGNAYSDPSLPALPSSLAEATDLFEGSPLAQKAFGPEVVEFYVHTARWKSGLTTKPSRIGKNEGILRGSRY